MRSAVILIFSCRNDRFNGRNDAARDTWLAKWGSLVDYKFVYGNPCDLDSLRSDEIIVAAGDSYGELTHKQRAAYRWFLGTEYDSLFVCYTDTYVHVPRLLASAYWTHLYTGRRDQEGRPFAGGGMGYWLNKNVVHMLARVDPVAGRYPDEDDGYTLYERKIIVWDDKRYGGDVIGGDGITAHLSLDTGRYDPQTMRDLHRQVLEGRHETQLDAAV